MLALPLFLSVVKSIQSYNNMIKTTASYISDVQKYHMSIYM